MYSQASHAVRHQNRPAPRSAKPGNRLCETGSIANFSLGGLHIRRRSADSGLAPHEPLLAQVWTATAVGEALGKDAHTIDRWAADSLRSAFRSTRNLTQTSSGVANSNSRIRSSVTSHDSSLPCAHATLYVIVIPDNIHTISRLRRLWCRQEETAFVFS